MTIIRAFCTGLLISRIFAVSPAGSASPDWRIEDFALEGRIDDITVSDLNHDCRYDLLVIHHIPAPVPAYTSRRITLLLQDETGQFIHKGHRLPAVPDKAVCYDLADADNDGDTDILFLTSGGVTAFLWGDSSFSGPDHLITYRPRIPEADPASLPRWRFARDITGDAAPELILPGPDELAVFIRTGNRYSPSRHLWSHPAGRIIQENPLIMESRLPVLAVCDFNRDSIPDFLVTGRDVVDVFLMHDQWIHHTDSTLIPPDFRYRRDFQAVQSASWEPVRPPRDRLRLHDLNRDNAVDMLISQTPGAAFPYRISQLQIYINRDGRFDKIPDQILTSDHMAVDFRLRDMNGDGLEDVILFHLPAGLTQGIKLVLTQKLTHRVSIHLMRPDYSYQQIPDADFQFRRKPLLTDGLSPNAWIHSLEGDFNGDNLPDLMIAPDEKRFIVYPGHRKTGFSKKDRFEIPSSGFTGLCIQDINEDRISDLILWDQKNPSGRFRLVISHHSERP